MYLKSGRTCNLLNPSKYFLILSAKSFLWCPISGFSKLTVHIIPWPCFNLICAKSRKRHHFMSTSWRLGAYSFRHSNRKSLPPSWHVPSRIWLPFCTFFLFLIPPL